MKGRGLMRKSEITAEFKSDLKTVWEVVTNNSQYNWRSDLGKVEVLKNGEEFIEYTKDGFSTQFRITKKEAYSQYEFEMQNKNFTGYWIGSFSETKEGGTKICFKENVTIKNPIVEILSYLFMDLKKIQMTYIQDLKKKLGEL
jgi:hypothetical protein